MGKAVTQEDIHAFEAYLRTVPARRRARVLSERVPEKRIHCFLRERWSGKPDALTVCGASQLTGYSKAIICGWITECRLIECCSKIMKERCSEMPKEHICAINQHISSSLAGPAS